MKPWRVLAALVLPLLAGCAGMRLVDTEVQAVATPAANAAALTSGRYRFERLPLQASQAGVDRLEAIVQTALGRTGMQRADQDAAFSVQPSARVQSFAVDAWGHPYTGPWWPGYGNLTLGTEGVSVGLGMRFPPPLRYRYEVSLLVRDLKTGQVVYQTSAQHVGPWSDTGNILAALFEAALRDFPAPPAGPRWIDIEIPR